MKQSFIQDTRGVVIGLVVMIATCIVTAMMWIISMPAVMAIWNNLLPIMPVQALPTMYLMNNVCGWTLVILIVGTIAYGAALSFRRDPVDVQG
jgi:hypothetical protein